MNTRGGDRRHLNYTRYKLAAPLTTWGISVIESGEKSVIVTKIETGESRLEVISARNPLQAKILAAFGVDTAPWATVTVS